MAPQNPSSFLDPSLLTTLKVPHMSLGRGFLFFFGTMSLTSLYGIARDGETWQGSGACFKWLLRSTPYSIRTSRVPVAGTPSNFRASNIRVIPPPDTAVDPGVARVHIRSVSTRRVILAFRVLLFLSFQPHPNAVPNHQNLSYYGIPTPTDNACLGN